MRALVLHWGRNGGGPRFAADAVAALRSADVWTAYSWSKQSERAPLDAGIADLDLPVRTFSSAAEAVAGAPRAVAAGLALRRLVLRERIDCVFASMEQIWQPAAAWSMRGTGVPYLLGMHDASFHAGDGSVLAATTRRLEVASADGLLAFSGAVAAELRDARRMPSDRIWSSFLPARAQRPAGSAAHEHGGPVRFGFFGRWQPYKGLPVLLEAVQRLEPGAFELHIHGDGVEPALSGPIPPGVFVHQGWAAESEVDAVISGFDVVVAPYIEASQSGVVPLAAALGVPAVVTPVGGLQEQVVDGITGLVADRPDAEALAVELRRCVAERGLIDRLGRAAADRIASERSIGRFGTELRNAMEELVQMGKRTGERR
jgi:glycosyltransferase involved in cell wall biosynthesis